MAENYEDIANLGWDSIPEPKVLPTGSWLLRTKGATYKPSKDEDKSPQVLFIYEAREPMSDVDAAELDALGEYDPKTGRIYTRFYVETGNDWNNVRMHIEKHGVETKGKSVPDTLKEVRGKDVIAYLEQRTYINNTTGAQVTENTAKQFAPVEG